jgi:glycosyltransferase involved in cell wall biosynthesis
MSICNMSIEGGARAGYVNPDETTYEWLEETDEFAGQPEKFERHREYWESIRSDDDAEYDDVVTIDGSALEPMVTWGTTPGQGIGISEEIPDPDDLPERLFHADFAVSTTSTTTYELLALGAPMIGIPVVDNQEPVAASLRAREAATVLDRGSGRDAFSEAIEAYVTDPELRRSRRETGRRLVARDVPFFEFFRHGSASGIRTEK